MPTKLTFEKFLERSKNKHGTKYDYSNVIYQNCDSKVKILCKKHQIEFLQTPYNHMNGFSKCPKCKTEKQKESYLKSFGFDNPMKDLNKQKQAIKTKKEKYGKDWNNTSKLRSTMLSRYGVDWNSKILAVFNKQQNKQKTNKRYIFPSGNTYNIQGYESMALDLLLNQGYLEEDITLKNRPSITYTTHNNKSSIYHPDIILLKKKKIIEVKSTYTVTIDKNLHQKQNACIDQGWFFEIWVFDSKSNLVKKIL